MCLLFSLGFSATYYQADQLEISSLYQPQTCTSSTVFSQYVFDNGDFNISTLDGLATFHSLGGIKCVTPAEALPKSNAITKLTSPLMPEVGTFGVLNLKSYENVPQRS